jgi:hypothetical protein
MLDVAHAQLAMEEEVENPQPRGVRQRLKVMFEFLQNFLLTSPNGFARLYLKQPDE